MSSIQIINSVLHAAQSTRGKKKANLTSGKVVVLFSRLPGAKACTFRCGGSKEGGPCRAEHHHLLQLGIVIHGGVREAQRLWDLQGWEDHLGLGCSHPLLVLELRWGLLMNAGRLVAQWQSDASQVEVITLPCSGSAARFCRCRGRFCLPSCSVTLVLQLSLLSSFFSQRRVKIHLSFQKKSKVSLILIP